MSIFTGKQEKGAMRKHHEDKRAQAEVRQVNPGARSASNLAVELGIPLSVIAAEVDELAGWTIDERVDADAVTYLRNVYGGAA